MAITNTYYATVEVVKLFAGEVCRESRRVYEGPGRSTIAEARKDLLHLAIEHNPLTDSEDVYVKCTYHILAKAVWNLG